MCTDIIQIFFFFFPQRWKTWPPAPLHWGNCRVLLPHLKPVSIIHPRAHKPYGGTRPFYHLLTVARRNSDRKRMQEMSMNTSCQTVYDKKSATGTSVCEFWNSSYLPPKCNLYSWGYADEPHLDLFAAVGQQVTNSWEKTLGDSPLSQNKLGT